MIQLSPIPSFTTAQSRFAARTASPIAHQAQLTSGAVVTPRFGGKAGKTLETLTNLLPVDPFQQVIMGTAVLGILASVGIPVYMYYNNYNKLQTEDPKSICKAMMRVTNGNHGHTGKIIIDGRSYTCHPDGTIVPQE